MTPSTKFMRAANEILRRYKYRLLPSGQFVMDAFPNTKPLDAFVTCVDPSRVHVRNQNGRLLWIGRGMRLTDFVVYYWYAEIPKV